MSDWNTGAKRGGRKKQSDKVMTALPLTGSPRRGWKRAQWFCKTYVKTPSGQGARSAFRLRPWQVKIVQRVLPMTGKRPRQAVIELARGQGKRGPRGIRPDLTSGGRNDGGSEENDRLGPVFACLSWCAHQARRALRPC